MILHGYFRSSAAYRTRIALNLKGVDYDQHDIDLRTGAQRSEAFLKLNPQGLVPALEVDGTVITQSTAILEWLDETYPEPALMPADAIGRAQVRGMIGLIASDIHPLNNLRVLNALRGTFGADQDQIDAWAGGWMTPGFEALTALTAKQGKGWLHGAAPTLADCYLIPQLYSARRFNVDLRPFPELTAIEDKALAHPAFANAHPDRQPGAD
ncbi:maleylacetoacetate isomerase [Brevundimonas sp. NIBR11]|uniref:maleylacetoacetate isomerase n=1 Tax=Brevundimonas sp. NIBR11 TaxID=3015999 RepID=UPI0022EFE2AD|nr:maleylacetoacetate isomerase [Brevundimonas sp. NIBR11]WGM32777.1 Maleylpyruvate isomerase [Brevundimonas sp. NIBR11]